VRRSPRIDAAALISILLIDVEKFVGNLPVTPIVTLAAGVLVLIYPKLLNYVVAAYLIGTGGSGVLRNMR